MKVLISFFNTNGREINNVHHIEIIGETLVVGFKYKKSFRNAFYDVKQIEFFTVFPSLTDKGE